MPNKDLEWTDLSIKGWGLYQRRQGLRFSIDAVLLAHFVKLKPSMHILDVCTGTGIIAFLMAARMAKLRIVGMDIQAQLIANALASRDRNGLTPDEVDFCQGDLRQPPTTFRRQFDLVTCNPPFYQVGHGAESPEPEVALARHELSCQLTDVMVFAKTVLKERGRLAMIHRAARLDEVMAAAHAHKLQPTRLQPIYARTGEAAKLFLLECCYLGRQDLTLEEPLYIYDDAGKYRPTIQSWYQGE